MNIREIRLRKLGMTQKEFADLVGVSQGTISHWESSRHRVHPCARALLKLIEEKIDKRKRKYQ